MTNNSEKRIIPQIDIMGRILPQAIDFEEALLGCMMLERNATETVATELTAEMFYKTEHGIIYKAIKMLFDSGTPIDLLSVTAQLRKSKELEIVGGSYYLATLTNKVVSSANIEYYARIVIEKHIGRKLIEVANSILTEAYDESNDVLELLSKYDNSLKNIFTVNSASVKELREGLIEVLRNMANNKTDKKPSGFPIGFRYFDDKSGGLQPGNLVVLAAETSQGKSSMAMAMTKNIAEQNIPIAFYSLEMSNLELCSRITAMITDISSSSILYSKLSDVDFDCVRRGISNIENLPIFLDDSAKTSMMGIIASIRYMVSRFGVKVVFIDYLQLATMKEKGINREQEVANMARSLKNIAKELNICVVLLSQLSRTQSEDKYPTLTRLRDSGQIEEAADVVMFIYRPETYKGNKKFSDIFKEKETNGYAEIIIAKGRNIGIGKFLCAFNAATTNFKDVHIDAIPLKSAQSTQLATEDDETPF